MRFSKTAMFAGLFAVVGVLLAAPANATMTVANGSGHPGAAPVIKIIAGGAGTNVVVPHTGLARIVCGGVKVGSGWQTWPTGGYVGEGCGAGIDFIATPTSSVSFYDFGVTAGASYTFQAWIPTTLTDTTLTSCDTTSDACFLTPDT